MCIIDFEQSFKKYWDCEYTIRNFDGILNSFCIMILLQDCRKQGVECGSLNENFPHRLIRSHIIKKN